MIDFVSKFDTGRLGIANQARRKPAQPALIMNETVISYNLLDLQTKALSNGLPNCPIRLREEYKGR